MFAMISGAWPRVLADGSLLEDDDDQAVERLVAELVAAQEAAGVGLIRDGDVRWADPGAAALAAIAAGDTGSGGWLERAWRATAGHTALPVAQAVPGPWTLAIRDVGGWGDPSVVAGRALELAGALAADLTALAEAGCTVVLVNEPAAVAVGEDDGRRAAFVRAQRRLLADAPGVHAMLAITGGSAHLARPATIFGAPYASYLFDLIAGPDNWYLVRAAPGDRGIVCAALIAGVPDARKDQAPVLSWAAHYAAASNGRGLDRVGIANASDLGRLAPGDASEALVALGRAATLAALPPREAVDLGMDPRSIVAKVGRTRP